MLSAGVYIATGLAFFLGLGIGAVFSVLPLLRGRNGGKASELDSGQGSQSALKGTDSSQVGGDAAGSEFQYKVKGVLSDRFRQATGATFVVRSGTGGEADVSAAIKQNRWGVNVRGQGSAEVLPGQKYMTTNSNQIEDAFRATKRNLEPSTR
jgi:hypothetical protein